MAPQDRMQQNRKSVVVSPSEIAYKPTLKGPSRPVFRSNAVRDMGSVLDLNPSVRSWTCGAVVLRVGRKKHAPDLQMEDMDGRLWLLDVFDRKNLPDQDAVATAASEMSCHYRSVDRAEIYEGFRLANAKDLLRYAGHVVPLGDRVRLLALVGEHGPLSFADCLRAVRETQPVAAIASLILQGYLAVELDDELIGPETMVRRISS
ncbi:hypothetical protein [Rhizobium sp. Rhizsp42]|uniref:hypothetical protein n=1 Tax=Rhizobium sp. Rhizsp42 TaxID=3243034 RepID=UPI0039AF8D81